MLAFLLLVGLVCVRGDHEFISALQTQPVLSQPCYTSEGMEDCSILLLEEHKRGNAAESLPCSCENTPGLLDLGRQYYPRYLPTMECGGPGACWPGPYHCRPRHYEVKVLKRRDPVEEISRRDDLSLPETLRGEWKFVLVKVTVSCECSL
ncbi:prothoracicotropic hormone [Homalodisca vitripennis]|uniref:prothoracicotropic hormone n=1 Tax=Homalodisca vitripennis TaxID=197043 RepID=UPI001EEC81C4|nr:prothoracicotropic hormone [Homalodisca vitripennis]